MRTRGAIDLYKIARPEILDFGGVKRDHLSRCSLFVLTPKMIRGGRIVYRAVTSPVLNAVGLCRFPEFLEP
jgi:hypothetical protein